MNFEAENKDNLENQVSQGSEPEMNLGEENKPIEQQPVVEEQKPEVVEGAKVEAKNEGKVKAEEENVAAKLASPL